jgi:uncharacterized protein with GYD domain
LTRIGFGVFDDWVHSGPRGEEVTVSKYLIKASYSPEGIKGVMSKGGTARVEAIKQLVSGVGGSMESFYFAFGGDDVYIVVDAPSHEAMAAVAGRVTSTGVLSSYETVVLLTAEQLDAAANMSVDYTPPGG